MKKDVFIFGLLVLAASYLLSQQSDFPELTGPYLGQKPPAGLSDAFAPSIIFNESAVHGCIAFYPDGKEIYWIFHPPDYGKNPPAIQFVRQVDGEWTKPGILEFSKEYGVMNISMAPDGKKLFFTSKRPWPDSWGTQPPGNTLEAYKVWYVERIGASWGEPKLLDRRINQNIMGVSSTLDGTLYTHGIKRIRIKNGQGNSGMEYSLAIEPEIMTGQISSIC
jgi:hypothetical protein